MIQECVVIQERKEKYMLEMVNASRWEREGGEKGEKEGYRWWYISSSAGISTCQFLSAIGRRQTGEQTEK